MVISLSSQKTLRLPSARVPASEAASEATPSIRSPSEATTQTLLSKSSSLKRLPMWRAAMAMPTAVATP